MLNTYNKDQRKVQIKQKRQANKLDLDIWTGNKRFIKSRVKAGKVAQTTEHT